MARRVHDLRHRTFLDDAPGVHHGDAIGHLDRRADVVCDEDHRHAEAALQLAQQQQDLDLHRGVERRRGLVGEQIAEAIRAHDGGDARAAKARALEMLDLVQIPQARRRYAAYPFEMSGGMRQRAMIALALACRPKLLLADEPTTALDATVQIQILLLLRELQRSLGMSVVFVTHDIGAAVEVSDRIAVMYAGRIVEEGPVEEIVDAPRHPYTAALLAATVSGASRGRELPAIPGAPPDLADLPQGCAFAPRCTRVSSECIAAMPTLQGSGHRSACRHPIVQASS